ncbi:MAG: hypothetical protein IH586_08680 [Anaerolineaceae bacterium]|nr:hypothetical protein [Anaerolineaceae bacterium]
MAAFYWDTLLPGVIERTRAAEFPTPDGYVLSTLDPTSYPGTYPDVDHEFQIKGRLAIGDPLDEDVVRRMMELQLKVMREDPTGLYRNPCAVQGHGAREYHVRRNSLDHTTNATMFLITGNVEILEEAWLYVAATKNIAWLEKNILDLEGAAHGIEEYIDRHGRVWSDVYYEDQVIQDGRVCDAQAFAANGFRLLAELERCLGREEQAQAFDHRSQQLASTLVEALPLGYWDPASQRFINWVDRSGVVHDHVHLLSNELPVLFGYARPDQAQAVNRLVDENLAAFQRFPTFVALDLAGYTDSEIGVGGPYDLCAAGRYWCWDAAFWALRGNGAILHRQLLQVARQAAKDAFQMGERYDMDYVYYIDGKDWHGAARYYEYPCVFTWVLVHDYLGLRVSLDSDLEVAPRLNTWGQVTISSPRYAVSYTAAPDHFVLKNLSAAPRAFHLDLSYLYPHAASFLLDQGQSLTSFTSGGCVLLPGGESCSIQVMNNMIGEG